MNVDLLGVVRSLILELEQIKSSYADLFIEKLDSEVFFSFNQENREEKVVKLLEEYSIECESDIDDWEDEEDIKGTIRNAIEKKNISELIINDFFKLDRLGENANFKIMNNEKENIKIMQNVINVMKG